MPKQRYYYHAAPPSAREEIERHGLQPGESASYGPPAVYLFRHELIAENYRTDDPMDVWKVDLKGVSVHPDPEDPSEAVYVERPVPPTRLTFRGTFLEGEELAPEDVEEHEE